MIAELYGAVTTAEKILAVVRFLLGRPLRLLLRVAGIAHDPFLPPSPIRLSHGARVEPSMLITAEMLNDILSRVDALEDR